jgi:hypothetical protein
MTLESKNYVASNDDIQTITRTVLDGATAVDTGARSYLRALIATTQEAIEGRPRQHAVKRPKLADVAVKAQLTALDATHERFYKIVLATCAAAGAKGKVLNQRSNFARTALYAVRTYVRAGNDITALAPARTSKASLMVAGRAKVKPATPKRLTTRAEKQAGLLVSTLATLAQADKDAAIAALESAMGRLAKELARLGNAPVRNPTQALAEHRPLRIGKGVFWPAEARAS